MLFQVKNNLKIKLETNIVKLEKKAFYFLIIPQLNKITDTH